MANPDLNDVVVRKKIIDEIKGNENVMRKMNEQRKFDIYRKRQAGYVLQRLMSEFDKKTVDGMRKVLSINPCKRIVDEQASLYVEEPERHFADADEAQEEQLKELYDCGKINPQLRLANRYFKLHGQSCLYVLPKDGKIIARALTPKDYDVIPDDDDAEKAYAYIINVFDPSVAGNSSAASQPVDWSDNRFSYNAQSTSDKKNESIADLDDKRKKERYVFWTDEDHFTTDGNGEIATDGNGQAMIAKNPIGKLPFVDIANEKDFQFFVQIGSDVAEFVIDLAIQLSDLANTTRLQNYSQACIASVQQPTNIAVGPNKVLWLQIDPNADQGTRPSFEFISPTPDIMGSLELLNVQLKMFLSSVGLNPGTVSGKNELEKFTSGIDHLLANLDKFRASKEDMDIFRDAETQLFELLVAWHETMFDVTDDSALEDDLKVTRLNDKITLDIAYSEPQAVMTQTETEESVIALRDAGLMTKLEAIKRIYAVDDAKAEEIAAELDAEKAEHLAQGLGADGNPLPVQLHPITGDPIPNPHAPVGPDGKPIAPGAGGPKPPDIALKGKDGKQIVDPKAKKPPFGKGK